MHVPIHRPLPVLTGLDAPPPQLGKVPTPWNVIHSVELTLLLHTGLIGRALRFFSLGLDVKVVAPPRGPYIWSRF